VDKRVAFNFYCQLFGTVSHEQFDPLNNMSNGKSKVAEAKAKSTPYKAAAWKDLQASMSPPVKQPPLFRPTDWLAFGITTLLIFIGYFLTLAPDLTLEDSGELAVGSYYAGIPHPPGYPVWTICTFFFSHLVPISNIAYRVAMFAAVSGALACGLLALIVSRGSSMMIEGIPGLKDMDRKWENAICLVSGFVSGMLMGFNGYMWSQCVIVEVYPTGLLSLAAVLLCLLRWIYAPHQRRYLYLGFFLFGICFTNHQTLILAAMGIEVAIAAGQPKLGRDLFLGNSIVYLIGLLATMNGMLGGLSGNPAVFSIYNVVGIGSIAACIWLAIQTKALGTEWKAILLMGLCWIAGASFYFYMPLAGMSNPPMQWGYPRTVEGFIHAFTRGQYEKTNPTDIINNPLRFVGQLGLLFNGIVDEFNWVYTLIALVPFFFFLRMQKRERAWLIGIFAIYLCMGVLLLILLNLNPDRQSVEISRVQFTASHALVSLLVGYGVTLIVASMASNYGRFRLWGICGGAVAAAFALYSLAQTTQTLFGQLHEVNSVKLFFDGIARSFIKDQYALPVYAGLLLLAMVLLYTLSLVVSPKKALMPVALAVFALMPAHSILCHWFENEQRGHLFGYWFGHDMFTPPFPGPDGKLTYDPKLRAEMMKDPKKAKSIYPEMTRDAVLYGGTDPGRFCPTYMIFNESFIPPSKKPLDPNFDRRDVYIITQNALADGTYLCYLRAQFNRSKQIDPPFFQELLRSGREKTLNYNTNLLARMVSPLDRLFTGLGSRIERKRRVSGSLFTGKDFTDLPGLVARLKKSGSQDALSSYLCDNLSEATRTLLSGKGDETRLRDALANDFNHLLDRELLDREELNQLRQKRDTLRPEVSEKDGARKQKLDADIEQLAKRGSLYDPERFKGVKLSETTLKFIEQNPQSHTRIRLNRLLLEEAYPGLIAKGQGGVYPDREIYIPTPEDSGRCFQEYMADAQRRLQLGTLKPGENVQVMEGKVQVSGQVAVMNINGLLTKVIFDHTPDHEFFVEESFPLDWMYPYLTPFGIIMKINRQPLPELTEDIVQRDHDFWSRFSDRLIGNWITYDTPVSNICAFAEKVYLRHDFSGFKGDRKFVRDDQGQKAFSKLRSAIGGVYAWRIGNPKSGEDQRRMIKEADFAFRQAFAFCPYSPEAVFRYITLLTGLQRFEEALLIARTCEKLDPYNASITNLVKNLEDAVQAQKPSSRISQELKRLEDKFQANPADFQNALNLAATYAQIKQIERAMDVLDQIVAHPKVDAGALLAVAQACAQFSNFQKLEVALDKLVKVAPTSPEAWYDYAALKIVLSKHPEAVSALSNALTLSDQRLTVDSKARNLRIEIVKDTRFEPVRNAPEFAKFFAPK
jgi:tetratricopeptide (TPR) repeat protein